MDYCVSFSGECYVQADYMDEAEQVAESLLEDLVNHNRDTYYNINKVEKINDHEEDF